MKITTKQAYVLGNLHRITFRLSRGLRKTFLDGQPCHLQINSLAAGGLIAWNEANRPVQIANPEGSISRHVGGARWQMPADVEAARGRTAARPASDQNATQTSFHGRH